jgi:hypothetical protein
MLKCKLKQQSGFAAAIDVIAASATQNVALFKPQTRLLKRDKPSNVRQGSCRLHISI